MHIDDVAAAEILAMEERKASGRIICSSSSVAHWSECKFEIQREQTAQDNSKNNYLFIKNH